MDLTDIKKTEIWTLYEEAVSYCRMMKMFTDTDVNYRMYNGDQWYGLKVQGVEKVQFNFIKPIVKYKTGIIMSNLYAVHFSSENFENRAFRKNAEKICKLLNKRVGKIWEKDFMDIKLRLVVKDAAINDEGIIYVTYDEKKKMPVNEILNKTDIFYGNENSTDIQSQPYILIKQRMPVLKAMELAKNYGVGEKELDLIVGDMETTEEAGESAKYEKDNMCTVVTKLYKENGTVHFAKATRTVDIKKDTDTGLTYYPVAHLIWEEKKGSARGEGEVRQLIPNQLETNKTAMRRALTAKNVAYPTKVANTGIIANERDLDRAGATIKIKGGITIDDVRKAIATISPAQMSPDVKALQDELIQSTRELAGAGDIATGQINPESASGRAILAVQQASQQPLTEHLDYTKGFAEDLARIYFDMETVYNDSITLEEEVTDPMTGEKFTQLLKVFRETLQELQAVVKVDITPKGAFDKYAQEQSLENLLTGGYFTQQRIAELKIYLSALDDDSVMPKQKLLDAIEEYEKEQKKIAQIQMQGQLMQQRVQQFLMEDPQAQAGQMLDARRQMQNQIAPVQGAMEINEGDM